MFSFEATVKHALSFVSLDDLPRFQAVDTASRSVLHDGGLWHQAASEAFPALELAVGLTQPPARSEVIALCSMLTGVAFADGATVPLRGMAELRNFAQLVRGAKAAAARHLATAGTSACVAVGCLCFPPDTVGAAFQKPPRQSPSSYEEPPQWHASACVRLRVPGHFASALGTSTELHLGFAWAHGCLAAKVQDQLGHLDGPRLGSELALDVRCKTEAVVVHQRGDAVPVAGAWELATQGLCLFPQGQQAATSALAEGLVCALCLKVGGRRPAAQDLAGALHLDV